MSRPPTAVPDAGAGRLDLACRLALGQIRIIPLGTRKVRSRGRPRKNERSPLSRWIDAQSLTRDEAARLLDITRPHIDRLCRGDRRPSLPLALKIERVTDGAVPVDAWSKTKPHSKD